MEVRKIPVAQGLAWFRAAIDIGARNPKAVFGASVLFIATLYGLAILLGVVAVALTRGGGADAQPDMVLFASIFVPLFIGLMVIMPVLIGGLMHVIREAEAGRPVRARDLFAPMRSPRVGTLALLGLVQIGFAILGGVVAIAIAGADYWQDYFGAVRGAMGGQMPVVPQPRHPGLLMVVQLAYNYFTYAVMLFAVPLVLFSGQGIVESVRNALRASVRNVGANLVAAGLFVAGTVVAAIIMVLLSMLANVIGALVHPMVGTLLSMLILLAFVSALLVVLAGGAYLAWRDTFGGDAPSAPRPFNGIEV
jgi:hypothetical protein